MQRWRRAHRKMLRRPCHRDTRIKAGAASTCLLECPTSDTAVPEGQRGCHAAGAPPTARSSSGTRNWPATPHSLMTSYTTAHALTLGSSRHSAPRRLPEGAENTSSQKPGTAGLCITANTRSVHNCQNLECSRCPSVGKWINEPWDIQTRVTIQH